MKRNIVFNISLIITFVVVIFALWVAFSKYGKIRLGKDDDRPEYSNISWFSMLFSAGMGVGLVFWGIAEPLNHFVNPLVMESGSKAAANFALKKSFFHWGLHPWANYAILALGIAYMQFRKGKPGLISSVFIPLLGEEKVRGSIGQTIDILAIFATVVGVATSLGMATLQMNSGLNYLFGVPETNLVKIIIISIITVLFMISAVSGLDKGIKILSNTNVLLCGILMLVAFVVGPSLKILNNTVNGMGLYFSQFIRDSLKISSNPWYGSWTIFYWAWWIAWAPFVGTFIARISKGRTIKEFIIGVLLAPTAVSFAWFGVFGTIGIETGLKTATEAIGTTSTAFFVVMSQYPFGNIISLVAVILLTTFFVTSADSATFVLGMLSSDGNPNPTILRKIFWGVIQSGLAVALILSGGLGMLQTGTIVAAFPFGFVMIFTMISITKALKNDKLIIDNKKINSVIRKRLDKVS